MLNNKVQDAFNGQLNIEAYSAYLYLAMTAYFESQNLKGFAKWMRVQAHEEAGHAFKFFDHIHSRGGEVKLAQIAAPPTKWDSPMSAFEAAHAHEQTITGEIDKLVDLAESENDRASYAFLQWFVNEQVEEEESVREIVERLKLAGDSRGTLFWMDKELGKRSLATEED